MRFGLSGLMTIVVVGAVLGLGACKKDNEAYCETVTECESGQACTEHLCVDVLPGDPDATPACPEATHQCLPVAPPQWTGPTIRADIGAEDPPPACATEEGGLAAGAGFEANAGSCECSCTTAATIDCGPSRLSSKGEPQPLIAGCGFLSIGNPSIDLPNNSCVSIPSSLRDHGGSHFETRWGSLLGGSCVQGSLSETLPATSFDESIALCPTQDTLGDCGEDALCAPVTPTGFVEETCIFREGEHDCPTDSIFSEQTITYASLDDTRACGACSCELEGTSCRGFTRGWVGNSQACNSENIAGYVPADDCTPKADWANQFYVRYKAVPQDVPCAPAEANPPLLGEVSGVDPVTVCCTAPDQ